MRFVHVTGEAFGKQSLQLELDRSNCLGVEKLAQVLAAQQLGKQVAIERQRLSSALGQRLVAFVHEIGHIREKKRRREGRRALRVHGDDADLTRAYGAQESREGWHVEVVAHHLTPGLGEDRKVGILPRHLEQIRAAHALLP